MKKMIGMLGFILMAGVWVAQAQSEREVLKVNYEYTHLSPSMISILRKQIPSDEQYQEVMSIMQQHKVFYSLYINTKTRESVFVLDSIQTHPHVSTTGHTDFVYTNSNGLMKGSEKFVDSQVNYSNIITEIDWELLDDVKEISGYECQNATIKGNPDVSVYFSKDIAINKGPAYFQGLFGLVLEANDFFGTLQATAVEYLDDPSVIRQFVEENDNSNNGKLYSVKEVLALKQNLIKTLSTD